MSGAASIPRIIVAGAGPGGLAAASMLRERGAVVTVLERAASVAASTHDRGGVVVGNEAWDVLSRVGGAELLAEDVNRWSERQQLVSLARIGRDLTTHANAAGAQIRYGAIVDSVADIGGDTIAVGITDASTGARELLHADWFIDATGGRSPLAQDARFARAPAREYYSGEQVFHLVTAPADASRPAGWSSGDGAFAINDRSEGVLRAYRMMPEAGSTDGRGAAALDGAALLRSLDIDPGSATSAARSFTARQTLAPHAASGRIVLVGDSVGTMMPWEQMGVSLALLDAERATQTIIDASLAPTSALRDAAVGAYDAMTVAMHGLFIL